MSVNVAIRCILVLIAGTFSSCRTPGAESTSTPLAAAQTLTLIEPGAFVDDLSLMKTVPRQVVYRDPETSALKRIDITYENGSNLAVELVLPGPLTKKFTFSLAVELQDYVPPPGAERYIGSTIWHVVEPEHPRGRFRLIAGGTAAANAPVSAITRWPYNVSPATRGRDPQGICTRLIWSGDGNDSSDSARDIGHIDYGFTSQKSLESVPDADFHLRQFAPRQVHYPKIDDRSDEHLAAYWIRVPEDMNLVLEVHFSLYTGSCQAGGSQKFAGSGAQRLFVPVPQYPE